MSEFDTAVVDSPEFSDDLTAAEIEASQPDVDETAAHEASLAEFVQLADEAAGNADPDTGTVTEAALDPVKKAYRAISGGAKFKNRAKAHMQDSMKAALGSGVKGVPVAVAWNTIQEAVAAPAPKAARSGGAALSPSKIYADKVTAHRIALDLIETLPLPEGVTEDWEKEIGENDTFEVAESYLNWLNAPEEERGEEPEVTAVIKSAVKLATSKGPRKAGRPAGVPFNGKRRDVAAHIREVFESVNSGDFLTISEIANAGSSVYGSDAPSSGAVNNRIFPPSGGETALADVLEPGTNAEGVKGAFKL